MFPVLDVALKPLSKNSQKACLMHVLIPDHLDFNAASQFKVLRYLFFALHICYITHKEVIYKYVFIPWYQRERPRPSYKTKVPSS